MKKVIAWILSCLLVLSLAACAAEPPAPTEPANDPDVEAYVKKYGIVITQNLAQDFAYSMDRTCTTEIKVVGTGYVVDLYIQEIQDATQEEKDQLQARYDSLNSVFLGRLEKQQEDVPTLTYFTINLRDVNGALLATIHAEK